MSIETISLGVIGAGGKHAGQSHQEQLAADPNCRLTVLSDIDEAGLERARSTYAPDADTTTYWEDTVGRDDIDAIMVMSPDRYHTRQLQAAVEQGKHAFVEKPLADTWDDFQILKDSLQTARDQKRIISSCHPRRFARPFINTKRLLDDNSLLATTFDLPEDTVFGPVRSMLLNLNYPQPRQTGLHTSFASDHLPHEFDTASHFFGFSGLRKVTSTHSSELAFAVDAEREDGIKLFFTGNRLQTRPGYREDWHVMYGKETILSVDSYSGDIRLLHKGQGYSRTPIDEEGRRLFQTDYAEHLTAINRHFVASVIDSEQTPPYLSDREMLLNTVVALAIKDVDRPVAISEDSVVTRL